MRKVTVKQAIEILQRFEKKEGQPSGRRLMLTLSVAEPGLTTVLSHPAYKAASAVETTDQSSGHPMPLSNAHDGTITVMMEPTDSELDY